MSTKALLEGRGTKIIQIVLHEFGIYIGISMSVAPEINNKPKGRVLITGASSGIGKSFAKVFAQQGYDLVLVARREDRLNQLAEELKNSYDVISEVVALDLAKLSAPKKIYDHLRGKNIAVDILVNNAGYSLSKPFTSGSWKEHQDLLNVMVVSLTQLCHLFSKNMIENGYGRIINVASIAAFAPEFTGNLYNAAKSYVTHMSEALDLELKPHGVHCLALCPGLTSSEFHDVMGVRELLNNIPKWRWMDSDLVAKQGVAAVMNGKSLYINGGANRALVQLFNIMPQRLKYFMSKNQIML